MTSQKCARRDFGSRRLTAAELFTLTLLRRGIIIHGATYFKDASQRAPVRDVATIVQYDTIAPHSSHVARGQKTVARHARCVRPSVLERRPVYGQAEHRETLDKLYIDGEMSNNINELINYFCQS